MVYLASSRWFAYRAIGSFSTKRTTAAMAGIALVGLLFADAAANHRRRPDRASS